MIQWLCERETKIVGHMRVHAYYVECSLYSVSIMAAYVRVHVCVCVCVCVCTHILCLWYVTVGVGVFLCVRIYLLRCTCVKMCAIHCSVPCNVLCIMRYV